MFKSRAANLIFTITLLLAGLSWNGIEPTNSPPTAAFKADSVRRSAALDRLSSKSGHSKAAKVSRLCRSPVKARKAKRAVALRVSVFIR